ncbi:glycine--tRNA ligase beta subunit [Striga asiatica]|uniref:Glycine--tRNA ligase beta subunit n=1 Tax=Striga asiatica TaxID=4170 RepID=A0A5A7RB67_STRAF|nr:glycine--tRNA ligase beta subunit [Striga asiatica]
MAVEEGILEILQFRLNWWGSTFLFMRVKNDVKIASDHPRERMVGDFEEVRPKILAGEMGVFSIDDGKQEGSGRKSRRDFHVEELTGGVKNLNLAIMVTEESNVIAGVLDDLMKLNNLQKYWESRAIFGSMRARRLGRWDYGRAMIGSWVEREGCGSEAWGRGREFPRQRFPCRLLSLLRLEHGKSWKGSERNCPQNWRNMSPLKPDRA